MAKPSEEISKYNANKNGKTDANLANDSNHLGGVPADDFATKKYVRDYHENKEELLKQYIDNQDDNTLDEAKSYTDTAIRNQDFSDFLKSSDKVALQNQISQCGENCANNLNLTKTEINNRINGIVTDVNSNFSDVNGAITNLNNTAQNLFTSVSNGKSQVASAITDKGISTASDATFETMANNIRNIPADGGGEGGGGGSGEDTSDATATSDTIFAGYTAYARGQKLFGTYVPPYEREEEGIVYIDTGIDTSDATATASDIAIGKTAYVNGNKITGTYREVTDTTRSGYNHISVEDQDEHIEEITEYYGASMEAYSIKSSDLLSDDNNTNLIRFNRDNTYSIQMCRNDGTDASELGKGIFDYTIVTHKIESSGQVWTTTNSVFDKCAWTKEELGLADNEVINEMVLGSPGVLGRSDLCWLLIEVQTYYYDENSGTYKTHYYNSGKVPSTKYYLYTFSMTKSGIIGRTSTNDTHFVWHKELNIPQVSACTAFVMLAANLNCNTFLVFACRGGTGQDKGAYGGYAKIKTSTEFDNTNGVSVTLSKKLDAFYYVFYKDGGYDSSGVALYFPHLSGDDRFVSFVGNSVQGLFVSISEKYEVLGYKTITNTNNRYLYVPAFNRIIEIDTTAPYGTSDIYQNKITIFDGGNATSVLSGEEMTGITSLGKITLPTISGKYIIGRYSFLSPDYSKLFVAYSSSSPQYISTSLTSVMYVIYDVEDLLHTDEQGNLDPIFTELQRTDTMSEPKVISRSRCSERLAMVNVDTKEVVIWNNAIDKSNVIMVKYKNMWFQRLKYGQLTAGQPDVKNGKTFIGWMGYPEIGNNTDI